MQNSTFRGIAVCLAIGFTLSESQALAGWMANADYTGCPSNITATRSSEGPFSSESDCLAKVRQAEAGQKMSCVKYSCTSQGAADSSSAQPGHEMDPHISKAISAGITGDISPVDAVGLATIGLGVNALNAPTKPKTAAELEAERVAAEKWAIESARRHRESEERKEARLQPMLALLEPVPSGQPEPPRSNFYTKGFEHGSQCTSQNAGVSCVGVPASEMEACVADYRAGYSAGEIKANLLLEEGYQAGLSAAAKDEFAVGRADPRAPEGHCRTEWIKSFERGHIQGKRRKSVN